MNLKRIIFSSAIFALTQVTPVFANATLTWNFQDAFFNDGTALTGSFTIDIDNNTVTSYDLQTQTGDLLSAFHYVNVAGNSTFLGSDVWGTNPNSYVFVSEVPIQTWGDPTIQISSISSFLTPGTNVLGTDPTNNPLAYYSNVTTEFNNDNSNSRSLISGFAITSPVPIPASIILFLTGLLGFVSLTKKRI